MSFPFSITLKKPLESIITSENQQVILKYVMKSILDDKADHVVLEELHVTFKGSTSNGRGSLFGPVQDGKFNLIYKDKKWWLNYQIKLHKSYIYTPISIGIIMAFIVLVTGSPWLLAMLMFSWVGCGNWIINWFRQGIVVNNIAVGIDELICGKTQRSVDDKMTGKLKSWF